MLAASRALRARGPHCLSLLSSATSRRCLSSATPTPSAMNEQERFLFDLQGFLVIPQVFSPSEVAAANAAVDVHAAAFKERTGALRLGGTEPSMAGDGVTGRQDVGGLLGWSVDGPSGGAFRSMLAHPRLQPYYRELCGVGYRLDHSPFLLQQPPGADGFVMHGGAYDEKGVFDHELAYSAVGGRLRCALLAASLQLTDTREGEGGFVILPGSHKSSFTCPLAIKEHRAARDACLVPTLRAGDVMLFTEAATHGTLAWSGPAARRVALYRFSPATCGYGRAYVEGAEGGDAAWLPAYRAGLSAAQAAVLEPPYHVRLDRPAPAADGEAATLPERRAGFKKEFDRSVFGTTYF